MTRQQVNSTAERMRRGEITGDEAANIVTYIADAHFANLETLDTMRKQMAMMTDNAATSRKGGSTGAGKEDTRLREMQSKIALLAQRVEELSSTVEGMLMTIHGFPMEEEDEEA